MKRQVDSNTNSLNDKQSLFDQVEQLAAEDEKMKLLHHRYYLQFVHRNHPKLLEISSLIHPSQERCSAVHFLYRKHKNLHCSCYIVHRLPGRWSLSVWLRIVCSLVGVPVGGGIIEPLPVEAGDEVVSGENGVPEELDPVEPAETSTR